MEGPHTSPQKHTPPPTASPHVLLLLLLLLKCLHLLQHHSLVRQHWHATDPYSQSLRLGRPPLLPAAAAG